MQAFRIQPFSPVSPPCTPSVPRSSKASSGVVAHRSVPFGTQSSSRPSLGLLALLLLALNVFQVKPLSSCSPHKDRIEIPDKHQTSWKLLQTWSKNCPHQGILDRASQWIDAVDEQTFTEFFNSVMLHEGATYNPNDPSYLGIIIGKELGQKPNRQWFKHLLKQSGVVDRKGNYANFQTLSNAKQKALKLAIAAIMVDEGYWKNDINGDGKDDHPHIQKAFCELAFNGGLGRAQAALMQALSKEKLGPVYQKSWATGMIIEYLKMAYGSSAVKKYNYTSNDYVGRLNRYVAVLKSLKKDVTVLESYRGYRYARIQVDGNIHVLGKTPPPKGTKTIGAR
ncbi:MAG: hypothetical protein U0003_00085 [Vampirovibrionales bacterium]